jgi:hypothetical protein
MDKYTDWGQGANLVVPHKARRVLAPFAAALDKVFKPVVSLGTAMAGKYNNMSDMEKFWKFKAQPWLKDNWHMLAIPALFGLGGMALAGKNNKALGGVLGAGLGLALKDQAKGWMDSGIRQFGNWTDKNLTAGTGATSSQTAGSATGTNNPNPNTGTTSTRI